MGCGKAGGKVTPGTEFNVEVAFGHNADYTKVNKFGSNHAVGTSFVPIARGGVYQMPTSPVALEFVAGATDAVDDVGMHSLTVIGLDANWNEQTVTTAAHATDGTNAVQIAGTWLRVYRAFVASSGTYATATSGSHVGEITIRVTSGGATWAVIDVTAGDVPRGQTEIAAYTVPIGYDAIITGTRISVSDLTANQTSNVIFFQRPLANDVTTPFTGAARMISDYTGLTEGQYIRDPEVAWGPFSGPCDLWFLSEVNTGTGEVEAEFDLVLHLE